MKIRIIGGSGSGKSYLANQLSKKHNIPHIDLDDIFWKNDESTYGIKNDIENRDKLLNETLLKQSWIIEGVYFGEWTKKTFEDADTVLVLSTNIYLQHFRVILRFIKRKLHLVSNKKKETLAGLWKLIIWNHNYNKNELKKIKQMYQSKQKFKIG